MSDIGRREVTYCATCRGRATQRIEQVLGGGDFGVRISYGLCEEHAAELVRETDRRYIITPLVRGKRPRLEAGSQEAWEFDC